MDDASKSGDESVSPLDPSADEMRRWGNAAVEAMAGYLAALRDRRVYPQATSQQIRERLDCRLPDEGVDFEQLLDVFRDLIVPMSRHNGHPRMFGYVQSPG